ncbi:MAG: F0F1 ATP synthase subunit B [Deltaproteobacteria bacterium]|nr:F0F1 ATP synthase subunit B [Deltaproteobacteria bacterium]
MLRLKKPHTPLISFLILILVSYSVYAMSFTVEIAYASSGEATHTVSEGGTGHDEGDKSGDLLDLLYRFINFALLVIILFMVLKKTPAKDFLSTRSEEIRQKLEDLRREKEEAESKYRDIEAQLHDFEDRRKDLIEQWRKEGLIEKEKIISDAQDRVKQIIAQSEITIQQEIQSARDRLKKEVVDLAAIKAQEILAKEINEKDQDQLIDDFLERVGKIH